MQVNDEEYKRLGDLGFTGTLPDRIYAYLGSLGYTGTINDRLRGVITPALEEWILANGVWNDNGVWKDDAIWNDGV